MIKILSESTINRIAAGEVIERPASVIKELVENSIDAGATTINIILEQAGKNLIIISDDGIGMSPEDLELAVQRHTTSKLDEENLENISSFGFRGEALPSISSISKITITSRLRESSKAYSLSQIGGKNSKLEQASHDLGTKTEIRDLFFATPARLKFLRTDKTELAACVDVIKKLALSHPHVSFSASHDNKTFLKVKGDSREKNLAVQKRILDIVGNDFMSNNAELNLTRDTINIYGFASLPNYHKSSLEDQHLFVNNRPVKDKILNMAVRSAYADYLESGRYPVIVLFLDIDPLDVDVNVHPAKSEVRFSDPNLIRSLIVSAIKDAISSNYVNSNVETSPLGYFGNKAKYSYLSSNLPNSSFNRTFTGPKDNSSSLNEQSYNNPKAFTLPLLDFPSNKQDNTALEITVDNCVYENFALGSAKAQLKDYIFSQTLNGFIVLNWRVASEKLCYEKIKQSLNDNKLTKERLAMPEVVELTEEEIITICHAKQYLSKLGLSIKKFGNKALIISEIPTLVAKINIFQLVKNLSNYLSNKELGEDLEVFEEYVIKTYAEQYSKHIDKLSISEMNQMLRNIEQSSFFKAKDHVGLIYAELKITDIEKFFKSN